MEEHVGERREHHDHKPGHEEAAEIIEIAARHERVERQAPEDDRGAEQGLGDDAWTGRHAQIQGDHRAQREPHEAGEYEYQGYRHGAVAATGPLHGKQAHEGRDHDHDRMLIGKQGVHADHGRKRAKEQRRGQQEIGPVDDGGDRITTLITRGR